MVGEKKKLKRTWGAIIVLGSVIVLIILLGWLIIPKIGSELTSLMYNLPSYATQLARNIASWFEDYPEISKKLQASEQTFFNLYHHYPMH